MKPQTKALRLCSKALGDLESAAWLATDVEATHGAMDPQLSVLLQTATDAAIALRKTIELGSATRTQTKGN